MSNGNDLVAVHLHLHTHAQRVVDSMNVEGPVDRHVLQISLPGFAGSLGWMKKITGYFSVSNTFFFMVLSRMLLPLAPLAASTRISPSAIPVFG